jgi:transcriptional regulator with XRE-family HTH domain
MNQTPDNVNQMIDAIRRAMQRRGWRAADLARAMGDHDSHVSVMLSGKREPHASRLQRAADALGMRWDLNDKPSVNK